jgi:thiol-disulfide isomerase/thioredoxin
VPFERALVSKLNKLSWILVAIVAFGTGLYLSVPGSATDIEPVADAGPIYASKLWSFEMPDLRSGQQSIESLVKQAGSDYVLVNFWASWCIPCRKEMPMLQSFANNNQQERFLVVGVAIDDEEKARPVVEALEIDYPILLADFDGVALMNDAGNEQGLLPYSVLLDSTGVVLESKLGELHETELDAWSAR